MSCRSFTGDSVVGFGPMPGVRLVCLRVSDNPRASGVPQGQMRKGMEMGKSRVIALLAVASIVAAACSTSSGSASPAASTGTAPSVAPVTASAAPSTAAVVEVYPRAETLYTTGKQWGAPVQWNPLDAGNMAMGVFGLQYEPLYMYDPLKDVSPHGLPRATLRPGGIAPRRPTQS